MVDPSIIPDIGQAYISWCWLKCSVEAADRRVRGNPGSPVDETTAFAACFADCLTDLDLPESQKDNDDDDDDDDDDN